mgnify:FL=1
MTARRTAEGLDLARLSARFGPQRRENALRTAERFVGAGGLVIRGKNVAVPPERFLVSDAVIEAFFET